MPDGGDTPQEVITAFVKQYYNEATFIPKEVVLPYLPEEDEKEPEEEKPAEDVPNGSESGL